MTHPDESVAPIQYLQRDDGQIVRVLDYGDPGGLTKREHFAALAMQSLIANLSMGAEIKRIFDTDAKIAESGIPEEQPQGYLSRVAISQADALIAALNAQPETPQ